MHRVVGRRARKVWVTVWVGWSKSMTALVISGLSFDESSSFVEGLLGWLYRDMFSVLAAFDYPSIVRQYQCG
jgi:hypothetical protein